MPNSINKQQRIETSHQPSVIRFGLLAIKNVGTNLIRAIIEEREENGKFKSIEDFITRIKSKDLNKKSLESLIRCGALDQFDEREKLLANLDQFLNFKKNHKKDFLSRQINLFGLLPEEDGIPKLKLKDGPLVDKKIRLAWEKELLGLYVSEHPLKEMKLYLKETTTPIKELTHQKNFNDQYNATRIAGIIAKIQKVYTRNNEPMLFVKIEDLTGSIEVLVFPSLLKTTIGLWQEDKIVSVKGRLSDRDNVPKLLANEAKEIETESPSNRETDSSSLKQLQITVPSFITQDKIENLKNLLANYPGENKVYLLFNDNGRFHKINTNLSVEANEELGQEIEKIIGPNSIKINV